MLAEDRSLNPDAVTTTFADAVMAGLRQRNPEITYGFSIKVANATPAERAELFKQMNPGS
jgi:hypothetical protein